MANITRPTVNVKPLRKIIIDVSPLSMFSDTIAFLIEFENVTLHCKLLKICPNAQYTIYIVLK